MPSPKSASPGGAAALLAPVGLLAALALPFFVLDLASSEATREAKLAAQAAGALLVLAGLARDGDAGAPSPETGRSARLARIAFALFLLLFLGSFLAGLARDRDPYDALPLLPALALLAWGASRTGAATARPALSLLVACGAATGLLAALQRFGGLFRLPVEAPEPRFLATALIGNPGDVGAALVVPGVLAAARLARGDRPASSAAALLAVVAGLAAAGTLAPIAGLAAGAAVLVLADPRRRLLPAAGAGLAVLAILAASGVLQRAAAKLASGDVATLTTQRDIGVLAGLETVREHPLLGVGPGGFASDFVRARLAAEPRVGRRLVHRSSSAHFDNAHNDPLTVAAETGLPATLALATALGAILACLGGAARRERRASPAPDPPAEALLAVLAAVLVLSLANFPVRIVPVAGPFAWLAGLALARAGAAPAEAGRTALRAGAAVLALLLAAGGAARLASARALARAESALRDALSGSAERGPAVAAALANARRAAAIRPRHATAILALGSARAAAGDLPGAIEAMERSRALEERAETLLNLGRLASALGDPDAARPFYLRAVWVFPRLANAIPPAGDPDGVVAEVRRLEAALPAGGLPPPAPGPLRPR